MSSRPEALFPLFADLTSLAGVGPRIAENMAVGVSRAPCMTASPPLETRVFVPNTAVVEINVGLQNAH